MAFFFLPCWCNANNDSASLYTVPRWNYNTSLSAAYTYYNGWQGNPASNICFNLRQNLNYDDHRKKTEVHFRFNGELGYMKFHDSIWHKNADHLDISLELVRRNSKTVTSNFTFNGATQFLSQYQPHPEDPSLRQWTSGFGNPLTADLSYGATLRILKNSRISFQYISFRTSVQPWLNDFDPPQGREHVYKRSVITSEYGFIVQTFISHELHPRLRWENHTRWFINGIDNEQTDLDFRNRFIFQVLKHLNVTIDTRLRYQPLPPYNMQFRNEVTLSGTLSNALVKKRKRGNRDKKKKASHE